MSPLRLLLRATCCAAVAHADSPPAPSASLAPLLSHVTAHRDGQAPASLDFAALQGDRSQLPVGVFDSGIGGLTVLEGLLALDGFHNDNLQPGPDGIPDFAGERFVYFGDQANMPYGNYAARGAEPMLHELIVKDAIFLLGRRYHAGGGIARFDKPPVKAIVIACNTATAFGIEDIRAALRTWDLDMPVIGVVEAGARAVNAALPADGDSAGAIAVFATVGTCSCSAYPRAIGRVAGLAGKHVPPIVQQGSVGLAGALEGNPAFISTGTRGEYLGPSVSNSSAPLDPALIAAYGFDMTHVLGDPARPETWQLNSPANYVRYDVVSLLENYRRQGSGPPIGTVVLGCTHFPIVQAEFAACLARLRDFRDATGAQPYRTFIAEQPVLVNPAEFTAKELFRELAARRLRADRASHQPPLVGAAFVSVPNATWPGVKLDAAGALDTDYKYSRHPGQPEREDTINTPMSEQPALLRSLSGLAPALPLVWRALRGGG